MQKNELKIFLANSDCGEIKYYSEESSWIHVKKGDKLISYEDYQKLEHENKDILKRCNEIAERDGQAYGDLFNENAKLKEANKVLVEALNKAIKSAEFFSRHADCKKDTWSCKCSFCRDTESGKNLRNAKEALEQYEKIMGEK